jgi:hypothetical protein
MFKIYTEPNVNEKRMRQIHLKLELTEGSEYVEMCAVDENGHHKVPLWYFSKLNGKIISYSRVRQSLATNRYDISGMEFESDGCMCVV